MTLRIAAILVAFLIALVALFPLRVALAAAPSSSGLVVETVDGTIWTGQLGRVSWRGHALGDFDTSLSPTALLPTPALMLANGTGPLESALLRASADTFDISRAELRLPLTLFGSQLGDEASIHVSEGALALRADACLSASGQVQTPAIPEFGLPAASGVLGCEDGELLVRVTSEVGEAVFALGKPAAPRLSWRSASSPTLTALLTTAGIPRSLQLDQ